MRPLTWAQKEVDPVGLHRQSVIHAQEIQEQLKYYVILGHLGQTCTLRLQTFVWQEDGPGPVPDLPIGSTGCMKPRASKFREPPAKVYNLFNTLIGLSHLCCHTVLYFPNNPSVIFLTHLHSISEYCRILNTPRYPRLYSN